MRQKVKRFTGDVRQNKLIHSKDSQDYGYYVLDKEFRGPSGAIIHYPFGFEPTYHRYRLKNLDSIRNGANILVGEAGEMFGDRIYRGTINEILKAAENHPKNNYLFETRHIEDYDRFDLPDDRNFWYGFRYGTEPERDAFYEDFRGHVWWLIEPVQTGFENMTLEHRNVDWIVMGGMTGKNWEHVTKEQIMDNIETALDYARKFEIPVYMKESLRDLMKGKLRKEYPEALKHHPKGDALAALREADCMICHHHDDKNKLITISAGSVRSEGVTFGWMCPDCFRKFCTRHRLEVPKLRRFYEKEGEET